MSEVISEVMNEVMGGVMSGVVVGSVTLEFWSSMGALESLVGSPRNTR